MHPVSPAPSPRRPIIFYPKAFTLIEVLVVVAIIALLIAILVPSLAQARESARTAVCLSNMSQNLKACQMQIVERGSRKERTSVNFGWAVFALKTNKAEAGPFTCPNDPDPKPIPGLICVQDPAPAFQSKGGPIGADSIFNRYKRVSGDTWQTDIENLVDSQSFGFDAGINSADVDYLFEFSASKGATTTNVTFKTFESLIPPDCSVTDYKGRTVWARGSLAVGQSALFPLLWMSYGANALAGLRSMKGTGILLIESGKPGIFPQAVGSYPADATAGVVLARPLRFRHGGKNPDPNLKGGNYNANNSWVNGSTADLMYEPRSRIATGFTDGHAETLPPSKVLIKGTSATWAGVGNYNGTPEYD